MQLFLKKQDKCKLEKGPRVWFLLQGEAIKLWFMKLSVKTLMCFLWLNYKMYATIFPLYFGLVSFLICVNYSVGILMSSLRFLCLKCLLTVGGTWYCDYYVWIWFICYASQYFKWSWFSFFIGFMKFLPSYLKTVQPKP